MSGLNLSKFKKIASDDSVTTLKHDDGHTLKVAHEKLSKKLKSDLDKLPIHAAEGVDTAIEPDQEKDPAVNDAAQKGVNININAQPQQAAPVEPPPPPQAMPVAQAPQAAPQQGLAAVAPAQPAVEQGLPQEPQREPAGDLSQPAMQEPAPEEAKPAADMGLPERQQAMSPKDYLYKQSKQTEDFLHNGNITPETYSDLFAKKSTLGKIGTIFGMLISGAGSGLSGQPNAMLKMMDNEIANDLDAQKQNQANVQNFIKLQQNDLANQANVHLTDAQAEATFLPVYQTRMMQASFHSLVDKVSKLPEGPQKELAKQKLGLVYNSMADRIVNVDDKAAGAIEFFNALNPRGASAGGSGEESFQRTNRMQRMLGPQGEKMAEYGTERHMPGLQGEASVPLTSGDREAINSGIQFDQKLHRFIDWTKKHSGALDPATIKEGHAMAAEVQGAYRQATQGGVYKEGEQNFISKIIDSDPTKFFNEIRVLPQLNTVASENKSRVNQLVRSKGFSGYSGVGNSDQKSKSGKDTIRIRDPKSGKVVVYDGKTKNIIGWE